MKKDRFSVLMVLMSVDSNHSAKIFKCTRRLNKNYRSTHYIVEAASCLIRNNSKRCQLKNVLTDNSSGSNITAKECCGEDAQCAFVVGKILEITSSGSSVKGDFGEIAVLYRRQVNLFHLLKYFTYLLKAVITLFMQVAKWLMALHFVQHVSGKMFQTAFRDK